MGQKVNSLGLRLGVNRTWGSKWYDLGKGSYSRWLMEDLQIRDYLTNIFKKQNILTGYIQVNRSKGKIFISFPIYTLTDNSKILISLPKNQLVFSSSSFWTALTDENAKMNLEPLEKSMSLWLKKPIHIKINHTKSYFEDSILLAQYVAIQLEGRSSVRNILKGCLEDSRKESAIRGIRIHCAGRLDGVEMAKNVWIKDGQVPLHTLHAYIDYGIASAYTIYGVCGVKAWICFHPKKES
jgi:small subunit ribosomal protein S3